MHKTLFGFAIIALMFVACADENFDTTASGHTTQSGALSGAAPTVSPAFEHGAGCVGTPATMHFIQVGSSCSRPCTVTTSRPDGAVLATQTFEWDEDGQVVGARLNHLSTAGINTVAFYTYDYTYAAEGHIHRLDLGLTMVGQSKPSGHGVYHYDDRGNLMGMELDVNADGQLESVDVVAFAHMDGVTTGVTIAAWQAEDVTTHMAYDHEYDLDGLHVSTVVTDSDGLQMDVTLDTLGRVARVAVDDDGDGTVDTFDAYGYSCWDQAL
jgi:hypothetical protein